MQPKNKLTVMKALLLLMLLSAYFSYAQTKIPDFGEFKNEEISLTECDFDKDADAVILFDVGNSGYNDDYNLITIRRIRFKILKQKGIERANIEIPYYSKDDFEYIPKIKAITYSVSENGKREIRELDKKIIFRQKLNERFSVVKFTLPNVKVGTIIEYEYETVAKHYGGLDDWYFQSDMPAILSRFTLIVVPNAEFAYVVHKSPNLPIKINSDKTNASIQFEMNNIAGLRYEPYMDAPRDYLQYVEFQLSGYNNQFGSKIKYMTTWRESAQELLDAHYFGRLIERDLAGSKDIVAKTNNFSLYDKMKFIYEYVRNNFSWNNISAKFADDGIKNAWANKKGTSAEINLILINLLKQAGLQVYPMLVSERDHGKVTTQQPMIDQFNKVIAHVTTDNQRFYLDATDPHTPINITPFNVLNTNAFIVSNKKPEVIKLSDSKAALNFINIYSDIDKNGIINGYANVNSYNYARVARLEDFRKNKEKFQHDYFEKEYGEIRIDSFEVNNTEADSLALQQKFKFSMPAAVSGDYKLINVNLFSGLEKNPFTQENRFTDVNFGCKRQTDITLVLSITDATKPEEIPKNVQLVTPDKGISFVRISSFKDNILTIQMSLKINETVYTADDYPMLKEFYKKMYNMLNEQIVLSNK